MLVTRIPRLQIRRAMKPRVGAPGCGVSVVCLAVGMFVVEGCGEERPSVGGHGTAQEYTPPKGDRFRPQRGRLERGSGALVGWASSTRVLRPKHPHLDRLRSREDEVSVVFLWF